MLADGRAGLASKDQCYAAKLTLDACGLFGKEARLDRGEPTEISETRAIEAVAADFDALVREVTEHPPKGVTR